VDRLTKKVARGGFIILVGQVLTKMISLALQVLLSQVLGPASYGIYAIGVGVIRIAQQAAQLGLANGAVRFIAQYLAEERTDRVKGTILGALGLAAAVSISASVLLVIFSVPISERLFHEVQLAPYLRMLACGLPVFVLFYIVQFIFRGFQRMGQMVGIVLFRSILQIAMVALVFLLGYRLGGAIVAFIASGFLALFLGIYLIYRGMPDLLQSPTFQLGHLLRFSIPVFFSGIVHIIMARADIIMIGYFLDSTNAGYYRAAVAVASMVTFMLMILNWAFAPMISQLFHRGNHEELRDLYQTVTRWIFLTALLGCLLVSTFSRPILSIFGPEFHHGAHALIILAIAHLVNAGVGSVGILLQMSGKQDWLLLDGVFVTILNLGLNVWLIPRWGIVGAAFATGISIVVYNLMALVQVRIFLGLHPWNFRYLPVLISGAASLIIWSVLPKAVVPWPLLALAMITTYAGCFLLFGLDSADRLVLDAFRRKASNLMRR
jgi:O-antigen/teichoic acid export membrane protein